MDINAQPKFKSVVFLTTLSILSAISYQSEAAKSKSSTEMIESKQVEEEGAGNLKP